MNLEPLERVDKLFESVLQSISIEVLIMIRKYSRLLAFSMIAFGSLLGIGCGPQSSASDPWGNKAGTKVLVSFAPLYSFATNVAGEDAQVKCLLTTAGPHAEGEVIREEEMRLARGANLLVINGLGLDDKLVKKLERSAGNKQWNLVEVGESMEKIDKKLILEGVCHHDHGNAKHDHDHGDDPHIWLCPKRAQVMVGIIRDELKKIDSAHAAQYDDRAKEYNKKLDQLLQKGKAEFADKKDKKFITFHDSLQYFADAFDLKIAGAIQVDPGIEPNEKKMDEIVALCVKEKIGIIAVEPQYPARTSAQKILEAIKAKGVDAQFVEVDPMETCDPKDLTPEMYLKKMETNIENLAKAFK
jgi:zinc transport system substrate-binding protein